MVGPISPGDDGTAATMAPAPDEPQPLEVIVHKYYKLAKAVGQLSLQGTGYEFEPRRKTLLDKIGLSRRRFSVYSAEERQTTQDFHAKAESPEDRLIAQIPEAAKESFMAQYLPVVASGQRMGTRGLPRAQAEYVKEFNEYVVPAMEDFISSLPSSMQQEKESFFTLGFFSHLKDVYKNVLCENLIEEFTGQSELETSRAIRTPIAYAFTPIADDHAQIVMGKRRWTKLFMRDRKSVALRYKKSANAYQYLKKKVGDWVPFAKHLGFRNRWQITEQDIAQYATLDLAFDKNVAALDTALRATKMLAHYNPHLEGDLSDVYNGAHRNVLRWRKQDDLERAATKSANATFDHSAIEGILSKGEYGPLEAEIVTMIQEHDELAQEWGTIIYELMKPRSDHRSGEDERNEGLLVKHDTHFAAMKRELNSKHNAGYFEHWADRKGRQIWGTVQSLGIPFSRALGSQRQRVQRWSEWLQTYNGDAAVPPNYLGKGAAIIGKEVIYKSAKKVYRNLRDGAPFFNPMTAVIEVGKKLTRGFAGIEELLQDAAREADVPDNPNEVTVQVPWRVGQGFYAIRPLGLPCDKQYIDDYLTELSMKDFLADEDNLPTLCYIGMANARLGKLRMADRYLRMAGNWAKGAQKLGLTDANKATAQMWGASALYDLSSLYATKEFANAQLRKTYLLDAFDMSTHVAHDIERSTSAADGEARIIRDPFNYRLRLEHLQRMHQAGYAAEGYKYSDREIFDAAARAYHEIDLILAERPNLNEHLKHELDAARQLLYKMAPDPLYASTVHVDNGANGHAHIAAPERKQIAAAGHGAGSLSAVVEEFRRRQDSDEVTYPFNPAAAIANDKSLSPRTQRFLAGLDADSYGVVKSGENGSSYKKS